MLRRRFTTYEGILYPSAPEERLYRHGIPRIHTVGSMLNPDGTINTTNTDAALAQLGPQDNDLVTDIETLDLTPDPRSFEVPCTLSDVQDLLDAIGDLRSYVRTQRPGTRLWPYAWFWWVWWVHVGIETGYTLEDTRARLDLFGQATRARSEPWIDGLLIGDYPTWRLTDFPRWYFPVIQGQTKDTRELVTAGTDIELIGFFTSTADGRVLEPGILRWLLNAAHKAGLDGAGVWVPPGMRTSPGDPDHGFHLQWLDYTLPAQTANAATWAAAGDVRFRLRVNTTEVLVIVNFAGISTMAQAAERLETAINAALDALEYGGPVNPSTPWTWIREHPGTIGVTWDGSGNRMVLRVTPANMTAPPDLCDKLTELFLNPPPSGTSIFASLLTLTGAGYGLSFNILPNDPWTEWVLPTTWCREMIAFARGQNSPRRRSLGWTRPRPTRPVIGSDSGA